MFELNEEQRLIQKSVHEFAKKELAPKASYWDVHEEFPGILSRKWQRLVSLGYVCRHYTVGWELTL